MFHAGLYGITSGKIASGLFKQVILQYVCIHYFYNVLHRLGENRVSTEILTEFIADI